jgi:hypothetical protein
VKRVGVVVALAGCASPQRATLDLRNDAAAAFASCDDDAILDAAARHGVQLALAPCGHNRVAQASWSPDGRLLLLRFGDSAYVMDPASRRFVRLTEEAIAGDGVWVATRRLALPLAGTTTDAALRLAEVDVRDDGPPLALYTERLSWTNGVLDLVGRLADGRWWALRKDDGDATATDAIGVAWSATVAPAPWPTDARIRSATLGPGGREALVADADGLRVVDTATGGVTRAWAGASAGALDATGAWVLATVPASAEGPATTAASARPTARPDLWLFDRNSDRRWRLDGLHGDAPAWYPGAPGWITWRLWGLDATPLRRNVALLDAGDRLEGLAGGRPVWGVTPGP